MPAQLTDMTSAAGSLCLGVMGRRRFRLFRMHYHGWLAPLQAVDNQTYTRNNERDAEYLAHIQDHIFLESYLRFLDELDKETHTEKHYEENTEKSPSFEFRQTVFVQSHKYQTQNQIA